MSFIKICAFSVISSSLMLLISNREKELSSTISATVFITVMIYTVTRVSDAVKEMLPFLESFNIINADLIIKICGISLVSFASVSVCESIGQKGIALSIEMLTTIEILVVFYPTIKSLTESIIKLIDG